MKLVDDSTKLGTSSATQGLLQSLTCHEMTGLFLGLCLGAVDFCCGLGTGKVGSCHATVLGRLGEHNDSFGFNHLVAARTLAIRALQSISDGALACGIVLEDPNETASAKDMCARRNDSFSNLGTVQAYGTFVFDCRRIALHALSQSVCDLRGVMEFHIFLVERLLSPEFFEKSSQELKEVNGKNNT